MGILKKLNYWLTRPVADGDDLDPEEYFVQLKEHDEKHDPGDVTFFDKFMHWATYPVLGENDDPEVVAQCQRAHVDAFLRRRMGDILVRQVRGETTNHKLVKRI